MEKIYSVTARIVAPAIAGLWILGVTFALMSGGWTGLIIFIMIMIFGLPIYLAVAIILIIGRLRQKPTHLSASAANRWSGRDRWIALSGILLVIVSLSIYLYFSEY